MMIIASCVKNSNSEPEQQFEHKALHLEDVLLASAIYGANKTGKARQNAPWSISEEKRACVPLILRLQNDFVSSGC